MRYLLDTHILLWLRLEPEKLTGKQHAVLNDPYQQKFISTISVWEISLKFALGKLSLGGHDPEEFLTSARKLGFTVVAPPPEQFASFHRLPQVQDHNDPFDRMLIWQAIQGDLTFMSHDAQLSDYKPHGLELA